ncbi:MAG: hypothetical protein AUK47_23190 [Deltaproteobacteria bacterium CG2_30_63_29]|nr:MAG: hypothetical protein AUK47_23190 [Deltaproteobacteria bacterium CG2_30_63_29]
MSQNRTSLFAVRRCALTALFVASMVSFAGCGDDSKGQDKDAITVDGLDGTLTVPCEPAATTCYDRKLATCLPTGDGWLVEGCEDSLVCVDGVCQEASLCAPGELSCDGDSVLVCGASSQWDPPRACEAEHTCREGICIPKACNPGDTLCGRDSLFICQDDGLTWGVEFCAANWVCFQGQCIECMTDDACAAEEACIDGECTARPLEVLTRTLPAGMVGRGYDQTLMARGGTAPYTWIVTSGVLPDGLTLSATGHLAGAPQADGAFSFNVEATDAAAARATAELALTIHPQGLVIATDSLTDAEEGLDYSTQLEALGGQEPYAWGLAAGGPLPLGLTLSSTGLISGIPSEIGDFPLTLKVFDDATPPSFAQRDLTLTVQIAPLEIIGDQQLDLIVTKVITLPMLTLITGIPVPYSTQLQARGGLKPYTWTEIPIPAGLNYVIPQGGIPAGLTLNPNGTLSGAVTDASLVVTVSIPFTQISLTGFFFMAEVVDSQAPAEKKQALFLIPTLPI